MVDYSRKAEILKCETCLGEIQSTHRHDFVYCTCKAIFTDGGDDYARYSAGENAVILKEFGVELEVEDEYH